MQILYGNDGMNYCTVAKTADVTENILNEIGNRGLLFCDFLKETYSSLDTEPVSFSYIVTSLNNIFPSDMMVIGHYVLFLYSCLCYS